MENDLSSGSASNPLRTEIIAAAGPSVRLLAAGDAGPAEVYVGYPDEERFDEPALRHVIVPWAGISAALGKQIAARPRLTLHNLHHNAEATAEMAIALLLAAARRIVPRDQHMRAGIWCGRSSNDPMIHDGPRTMTLEGGRCVVLGYGRIGQRVGAVCQALGMSVTGVARRARPEPVAGVPVIGVEGLLEAVRGVRALIITCPATKATHGLVDEKILSAMGPRSVLVNVGRASVLDQAALYHALAGTSEAGSIGAAGQDVWWIYDRPGGPARVWPSQWAFDRLDNCVMSPHTGGAHGSPELETRRNQALGELLSFLARGEMVNLVDLREGY